MEKVLRDAGNSSKSDLDCAGNTMTSNPATGGNLSSRIAIVGIYAVGRVPFQSNRRAAMRYSSGSGQTVPAPWFVGKLAVCLWQPDICNGYHSRNAGTSDKDRHCRHFRVSDAAATPRFGLSESFVS